MSRRSGAFATAGLGVVPRSIFEPERFFDAGDRVLVFVRASATGKGSGAQVELRVAHEFAIRDGRVVRFKVYPDREQALEAVGLGE